MSIRYLMVNSVHFYKKIFYVSTQITKLPSWRKVDKISPLSEVDSGQGM